jgi:hypothetical protein
MWNWAEESHAYTVTIVCVRFFTKKLAQNDRHGEFTVPQRRDPVTIPHGYFSAESRTLNIVRDNYKVRDKKVG